MNIYKKTFIALIPVIPLYLLGVYIVTSDPVHIFGFLSYFYFILALLVSPLAYIFNKIPILKRYSNFLISLRRQLGILTGIFAFAHTMNFYEGVIRIYEKFFASSQTFFEFLSDSISGDQGNVFGMNTLSFWLGTVGICIMFFLFISSNNVAQKILGIKNWKRLQSSVYPLFLIMVGHIYFVGGWKGAYLYPAIFLICLRIYIGFDKSYEKKGIGNVKSQYKKFLCPPCGYIYDEELGDEDGGLPPGTKYEDIPDDWVCPICGAAKKDFELIDSHSNSNEAKNHELAGKVYKKKCLTKDVIELQVFIDQDIQILPGQFCNIIINSQTKRSYSVSSYKDHILSFLIKLKKGGKGGEYLLNISVGENIFLEGGYGSFILQNTSNKKVFIATGTGLSPIHNMMHHAWREDKVLYFGVQKLSDLFYMNELRSIPNLTLYIFLSQEKTTDYYYGRIGIKDIPIQKHDEVYICGNPYLIEESLKELKKKKHQHIYTEKFL